MADSFTSSLLLRKPEINANQNAWGLLANEDFGSDRLEQAIIGTASYALSGTKTLSRVNGETDEARMRVQNITGGTGGTVTIPAVPIWYWFINGASGPVTVTNGSNSVVVPSGSSTSVFSPNGSALSMGLTKGYVDGLALSTSLPGQTGNAGSAIFTDGTNASWVAAYTKAQTDEQFAKVDLSNVTQASARTKVGAGTMAYRNVTISTAAPSGGASGDFWAQL